MSPSPRATHRVAWTESAAQDLEEVARHIAADSPQNAARVLARLRDRAAALERFPERGRIVPEFARFGIAAYRELVARPFRIIYRVHGRDVYVLAALDGRRDVEELLFERMACRPPERER